MAGIDSSIYFQQRQPDLPNPLAQAAQLSQLQGGMAQNALAQTKLAQAQRQDQQEQASNAAYSSAYDPVTGKVDPNKVYASLSSSGNGGAILPAQKQFAEQAKAAREQEKAALDSAIQKQGVIAQTAAAAKDQASWDSGLQSLQQMGIDTTNVPKVYDPATADMLLKRSLTGVQQLEQTWKQKGYDLDVRKVDETGRHNQASEQTARGQLGVAQGQLGVSRARLAEDKAQPKGQYDPASGMIIDTRTGIAKPVTTADGTPVVAPSKALTETQGKATGFAARMQDANNIISQFDGKVSPSLVAASSMNGIAGTVGNYAAGKIQPDSQLYQQAQENWVTANLRLESGAAIGKEEKEQEVKKWFPQPGDTPSKIIQKANSRKVAERAMAAQAGSGAKQIDTIAGGSAKPISTSALPSDINDLLNKYGGQ